MTPNTSADMAQNFPAVLMIEEFEAVVAIRDAGKALWPLMLDRNELIDTIEGTADLSAEFRKASEFQAYICRLSAFANQAVQRLADIAGDVVASTRTAEV